MKNRFLVTVVIAGLLGLTIALGWVLHARGKSMERLQKERDEVCQRLKWDLEGMIRNPQMREDLRARIQHHHLDQGLAQLCLGTPMPVDTHDADARWIASHDESGYLDVARALLEKYKSTRPPQ